MTRPLTLSSRSPQLLLLSLILFLGAAGLARAEGLFRPLPAGTEELDAMRWQLRPVLLFAPSRGDAAYEEQRALFQARAPELEERDIVVLSDTDPKANAALRARLGLGEGFAMVLVGKDGGVKLISDRPLQAETLFATIDRMPMRQRELRGKS